MSGFVAALPTALVTLEANGLGHRYGGGRGLKPVSFRFTSPGAVAVTGANGSGKSTLLRILAGLLSPNLGTHALALDGASLAPRARRGRVGYAASELSFYEELSARENLAFAAESLGLEAPVRRADEALARTGLARRAGDRVGELSSGMKQRLRLAFALLAGPALLLLDEPGTHLDEEGRTLLAGLVADHARSGLVLLATNDEREWRLAGERCELSGRGLGDPS